MNSAKRRKSKIINKIPSLGILFFILLFFYSTTLYPGGSQANLNSEGFDWVNNFWCNLMNEKGINGQPNPARPYSIFAMTYLCLSLMIFFIRFSEVFSKNKRWSQIIKIGGILSMVSAIFISTKYHDLMTIISSSFGLFVVIGIIKEIYQSDLSIYKITGVVCLVLLGVNNYIYYSNNFIIWLPLIQKFTFIIVLAWIVGLNYRIEKLKFS